ncbi:MAG: hypothetical protein MI919_00125 [Holophagales bacterium]|nr:hypothetical protein [Holophagales bacterium]
MSLAARALPETASLPSSVHLLRDRRELFSLLARGEDSAPIIRRALVAATAGSAVFGLALGSYAQSFSQLLASGLKLPILLLGAAALSFPCFHVLQSWRAPRPLGLGPSLALQSLALAAVGLVWGSLAPPIFFLVGSTQHYRLCQFLAVGVGVLGGIAGLATLWGGYRALCLEPDAPLLRAPKAFLGVHFLLFGAVGGQLAWILRPFIGSPSLPFQIFREADPEIGNFFVMLLHMSGG